jgi:hypothetical protein
MVTSGMELLGAARWPFYADPRHDPSRFADMRAHSRRPREALRVGRMLPLDWGKF